MVLWSMSLVGRRVVRSLVRRGVLAFRSSLPVGVVVVVPGLGVVCGCVGRLS